MNGLSSWLILVVMQGVLGSKRFAGTDEFIVFVSAEEMEGSEGGEMVTSHLEDEIAFNAEGVFDANELLFEESPLEKIRRDSRRDAKAVENTTETEELEAVVEEPLLLEKASTQHVDSDYTRPNHSLVPRVNGIETFLDLISNEPVTIHQLIFFFFTIFDALGPGAVGEIDVLWKYISKHPEFLTLEVDERHTLVMRFLLTNHRTFRTLELLEDLLGTFYALEPFCHQQQLELYALIASQCREAEDSDLAYFVRLIGVVMKYYEKPITEEGVYQSYSIHYYFTLDPDISLDNRTLLLHLAPLFKPLFWSAKCPLAETIELWEKVAFVANFKISISISTDEHLIILNSILIAVFNYQSFRRADENLKFIVFEIQKLLIPDHQNRARVDEVIRRCWLLDLLALLDSILLSFAQYQKCLIMSLAEYNELVVSSVPFLGIYLSYYKESLPMDRLPPDSQVLLTAASLTKGFQFSPDWLLGPFSQLSQPRRQSVLLELARIHLVRECGIPYSSVSRDGMERKSILEIWEFVDERIGNWKGK